MNNRFAGKVALVTGGGSGIGRAVALALAAEGATVAVAGRSQEALAETVKLIETADGTASYVTADVTDPSDVAQLVSTVVSRHNGLHLAVNNAGIIGAVAPVADFDDAIWSQVLATNLTGVYLSMKHEIRHMRSAGGGAIVNIASNIGAHSRRAGMAAYISAKAGVSALTRVAARDHAADNIRINAVSPGPSDTQMSLRPGETEPERAARLATMIPAGRVGALSEIASAVLWLLAPESGFTLGHDLVVDGGVTTHPTW